MSLYEQFNPFCIKCNNKDAREIDKNNGVCLKQNVVSLTDSGRVRCVGHWGMDKVYFLQRYVDIVGRSMFEKWEGLVYVEICSGPGRCIDRISATEFIGSPLAVLSCDGAEKFSKFVFIDYDQTVVDILRKRIEDSELIKPIIKERVEVVQGDYNKEDELINILSPFIKLFNLATVFVDPTDLSVPFSLFVKLSKLGRMDFIVNEAIYTDYNRNSLAPFKFKDCDAEKKWSRTLGIDDIFRSDKYMDAAKSKNQEELRGFFHETYISQFMKLGYNYHSEKKIMSYYYLLYLSKHSTGLRFWKEACRRDSNGQKELF